MPPNDKLKKARPLFCFFSFLSAAINTKVLVTYHTVICKIASETVKSSKDQIIEGMEKDKGDGLDAMRRNGRGTNTSKLQTWYRKTQDMVSVRERL